MRRGSTLLAGAAIAALLLWARSARAAVDESTGLEEVDQGDVPAPGAVDDSVPLGDIAVTIDSLADPARNVAAGLYMIRRCEHKAVDVENGSDYGVFFGGAHFSDYSDHPVLTGELKGVPLDSLGPRYQGKVSTAAGAYQITAPTWRDVREAGAWGERLPDFSPESQDEAARRILFQARALDPLQRGDVQTFIARASSRWASLPGSTAGQGGRTLDFALASFSEGLSLA